MVSVDVAGDERRHADRLRKVTQRRVAVGITTFVRPLQLDEEPVPAEGPGQPGGGIRIADGQPAPCAAGEADQPVAELFQQRLVERRVGRWLRLLSWCPRVRVCGGEKPTEV